MACCAEAGAAAAAACSAEQPSGRHLLQGSVGGAAAAVATFVAHVSLSTGLRLLLQQQQTVKEEICIGRRGAEDHPLRHAGGGGGRRHRFRPPAFLVAGRMKGQGQPRRARSTNLSAALGSCWTGSTKRPSGLEATLGMLPATVEALAVMLRLMLPPILLPAWFSA